MPGHDEQPLGRDILLATRRSCNVPSPMKETRISFRNSSRQEGGSPMLSMRAVSIALLSAAIVVAGAGGAHADDPFYKGKRLTLLINFAAGGPSDIEGRLLAKHIVKHLDGAPNIIVQNKDGAGGLVGANYIGEVGPKDGTMFGYVTATAWPYVIDPATFRVDLKSYEFVASQPGNAVSYIRSDAEPGMKAATDLMKATSLVAGGLSVDSSKDILIRLQLDMLGLPYRYVTGYRSNTAARLAIQRNEVNFFSETTPAYFSVVEPGMVKPGQVLPVYYDANYNGEAFSTPKVMEGSPVLPFQEYFRKVKGTPPSGQLWDVYRTNLAVDSAMLRLIVMPPGSPKAAVDALRAAVARLNGDKDYAEEAMKTIQFVPQYETGANFNEQVRRRLEVKPEIRMFVVDYMKAAKK
jgi:tripartite-type tricarboxylate transporter receptor subunit TctC